MVSVESVFSNNNGPTFCVVRLKQIAAVKTLPCSKTLLRKLGQNYPILLSGVEQPQLRDSPVKGAYSSTLPFTGRLLAARRVRVTYHCKFQVCETMW